MNYIKLKSTILLLFIKHYFLRVDDLLSLIPLLHFILIILMIYIITVLVYIFNIVKEYFYFVKNVVLIILKDIYQNKLKLKVIIISYLSALLNITTTFLTVYK